MLVASDKMEKVIEVGSCVSLFHQTSLIFLLDKCGRDVLKSGKDAATVVLLNEYQAKLFLVDH